MKTSLILTLIALPLLTFIGCKELDQFTMFDYTMEESIDIPGGTGIAIPFDVTTPAIPTNIDSVLEKYNSAIDLVESIKLHEMLLSLPAADSQTLSFFQTVELFISSPGLPEVRVAYKDLVPENTGQTLMLDTDDEDMKPYLLADNIQVRVKATMRKPVDEDVTLLMAMTYRIDAKILGL